MLCVELINTWEQSSNKTFKQEPLKDFQWATLEEMQQMLDRNTFKAVEQMLMPED